MYSKRAQGLSFNTIIIAVLGLTVLVVLFFIFNSNVGDTAQGIGSCVAKGGTCMKDMTDPQGKCGGDNPIALRVSDSACSKDVSGDAKGICCLPLGSS